MKTTLEIPNDLFRHAKATAALRGESLKDLVAAALRGHLEGSVPNAAEPRGWRSVFGRAQREDVEEIDRVLAEELRQIDLDDWR